jgi:cobalamin biosynthesis Mg chelatase CobN
MTSLRIIATACLFFAVVSCKTKKNIQTQSSLTETNETHESTGSSRTRDTEDWLIGSSGLERRDGTLRIDFDGPAVIDIGPDQQIRASGNNPTITGTTSSSRADSTVQRGTSTRTIQKDTTSRAAKQEKEEISVESKEVIRTPSLTPWIGAGIAVAIVVLAVLWFVFRKPKI